MNLDLSIFDYAFMQRALAVGAVIGLVLPFIGVTVVLKRLSMIGDALAHSSLAGVAAGLLFGFNPLLGAGVAAVVSALSIEAVRKRLPAYAEISIVVILSAGVGLAGLMSSFVKSSAAFHDFLFGSIVAITDAETILVLAVSALVLIVGALLYHELFYLSLDEVSAELAGVPVGFVNASFTVLTALTVAIAARTVGALIVSSVMVLPVACALQVASGYKRTIFYASGFGLVFVLLGLVISFYADLKPGAAIVLLAVLCLIVLLPIGRRRAS